MYRLKCIKRIFLSVILLALLATLCGCNDTGTIIPTEDEPTDTVQLIIPDSDDLGRGTLSYGELEYSYPDTAALISGLTRVRVAIEKNESDFSELLEMIREMEPLYTDFLTAYSYLSIETAKDLTREPYATDYARILEEYPAVLDKIEEMSVAAATSPHAALFESEYFGDGFIEEYENGEKYTDAVAALLTEEAALEAQYATASEEELSELLVSLIKVRRLIADEMGYSDYSEYAYEQLGHGYSTEDMLGLTDMVAEIALPIYQRLYHLAFKNFFAKYDVPKIPTAKMMNTLGSVYADMDEELSRAYGYMLHYGLFDIGGNAAGRRDGAFTVYLHGNASPFVFMTCEGNGSDYATLAHEFGHFNDMLENDGSRGSLDLEETASIGLELLTVMKMRDHLSAPEYKHLYYTAMQNALITLITQSAFAKFEHYAYALAYQDITEERLTELLVKATTEMGLNPDYYSDLDAIAIPHVVLYPLYVQSYVTSTLVALDICFGEADASGVGVSAYYALLKEQSGEPLAEQLFEAKLASPFSQETVKDLCDRVYFSIIGAHYFKGESGGAGTV